MSLDLFFGFFWVDICCVLMLEFFKINVGVSFLYVFFEGNLEYLKFIV